MLRFVLGLICSFIAYLIGATIEIQPSMIVPGFGVALAVITMGGFILFPKGPKE